MSSFNEIQNSEVQENDTEVDPDVEEANDTNESELQLKGNEVPATSAETLIIKGNIVYCPICSLPPEFCENGPSYDRCLPWITQNCPEILNPDVLAKAMGAASISEDEEKGEVMPHPVVYLNISHNYACRMEKRKKRKVREEDLQYRKRSQPHLK